MDKRRALVTGSSRGIGRAIAVRLGQEGYHIIVHAAGNIAKAEETKKIIEENGSTAEIIIADLCDISKTDELIAKMGNLDVLVLNASLQIKKPWQEISFEDCQKQLTCNYISSLRIIQAAVSNMQQNKWGRILTVGSVQESKPHPDMLVYSASKCAQTNTVKSLALQLGKYGITVNNIAPGVIYTDRNIEALSDKEYAQKVTDSIPLGFYGLPEDIADTAALICSEKGRYITGQSIYIDGGKGI